MAVPPPQSGPPPEGEVSIQTATLVCIWVLFGISSVAMTLRIWAQVQILRTIRLDDGLMCIAWIFEGVSSVLCSVAISHGLGRHEYFLTAQQFSDALKYHIIGVPFGMLSAMFGRISAAVLLLLFITAISKARKYILWILIGAQIIFNIAPLIVTFVICRSYIHSRYPSESTSCWRSGPVVGLDNLQGGINIVSDLSLSVLGLTLVSSLTSRTSTKILLLVLLSLSLVATGAAILKVVVFSNSYTSIDRTFQLARWNYWYSIESAAIIVATSVPKMWPLFPPVFHKYCRCMERWRRWRSDDADVESGQSSSERAHVRSISESTGKDSGTRLHDSSGSGTTDPENTRQDKPTRSIYTLPRRDHRPRCNLSDTFALGSLAGSSSKSRPNMSRCSSDHDVHVKVLGKEFIPCSTPRLTSRTVVSAGGPLPPSVPASILSSSLTPSGSGRTSRNSVREDLQQQQQQQQQEGRASPAPPVPMPFTVEGQDSPILASGPFCIWQTSHFTVEYEDSTRDNPPPDVDLGWTVLRNDDLRSPTADSVDRRYSESEADGLQLHDVGSILTDHVHDVPLETDPQPERGSPSAHG